MNSTLVASFGVFRTLFDSAKALKDMNDAHIRHAAVIELQEKIFAAQATQTALLEQVGDLEKQVASFETWDAEKQRYEMSGTQGGGIVYRLKSGVQPPEPAHTICTNCYQHRKKSILQTVPHTNAHATLGKPRTMKCPECKTEIIA